MADPHRTGQGGSPAPGSESVGLVLHSPRWYDLRLWLTTRGRERAFRTEQVRLARLAPGDRVLDVGCGTGTLAIAMKQRVGDAGSVAAIDPSPEMIRRARGKARRARVDVDFSVAAAQRLPYAASSFDAVVSTFVLHQLPADSLHAVAAEMCRVLRPGGRLLLVDIGGEQPSTHTVHARRAAKQHVGLFDLRTAAPMLEQLGLVEIARGDISFPLWRFDRVQYLTASVPQVASDAPVPPMIDQHG